MNITDATLQAKLALRVQALQAENERLRADCAEAYQVIGAGMLGEPCAFTQADVERALDNLLAAAEGKPRPHEDLLPWPKPDLQMGTAPAAPRWPQTPADVRAFIGPHFSALNWGNPPDETPHEDDSYMLSAHDLLSAFRDWEECGAALADQANGGGNG